MQVISSSRPFNWHQYDRFLSIDYLLIFVKDCRNYQGVLVIDKKTRYIWRYKVSSFWFEDDIINFVKSEHYEKKISW